MSPPQPPAHSPSGTALSRLAGRVGGHTAIYTLAAGVSALSGVFSLALFTRYLGPADFGQLAVLLVTASLLTLVYNAGTLQGTMAVAFGRSADDDAEVDEEAASAVGGDRGRALATGLCMTLAFGMLATGLVAAVAEPAANALLGSAAAGSSLVLAASAAACAAVWRLAANVLRLERRPAAFLSVSAAQHVLGVVLALPFLAAGLGVRGAVAGLALGNGVAALLAVALIRPLLRAAVSWRDATRIVRAGRAMVPVVVSFHTMQLADVLLLSRFVVSADVGLYRAANRIGSLTSYWTTSFMMAWGALRHDPVHAAADEERGAEAVARYLTTYFWFVTLGVILALAVFAEEILAIVAPGFSAAAPLVPFTAAGFAWHGLYVMSYRIATFPGKRTWFIAFAMVNAMVFVLASLVLIPVFGAYGASVSIMCGWSVGTVVLCVKDARQRAELPYDPRRLVAGLVLALACLGLDKHITGSMSSVTLEATVDALTLVSFAALLIATRLVPLRHVRAAVELIRLRLDGGGPFEDRPAQLARPGADGRPERAGATPTAR
jgi:O-antigen/teichoic acid export membrane protein